MVLTKKEKEIMNFLKQLDNYQIHFTRGVVESRIMFMEDSKENGIMEKGK